MEKPARRQYRRQLEIKHPKHKQFLKERLSHFLEEDGVGSITARTLLALLLIAGTLTVAVIAPNIISVFLRTGRKLTYRRSHVGNTLTYLKRHNLVKTDRTRGSKEFKIALTKKGETLILKRALGEVQIATPNKWDGVWRIIIFDIPNTKKAARDGLRDRLKAIGLYRLQESVFVFPYPCKEELYFLMSLYRVGHYVRLIETPTIIYDDDLKDYFSLI